jgi:hypothetical protein
MASHGGGHCAAMIIRMMSTSTSLEYPGARIPIRHTFPAQGRYHPFLPCAPGGKARVFHYMLDVAADASGLATRIDAIVPNA